MRLGNLDERDPLQGPFRDDVITSMIGFGSSASISRILKLREVLANSGKKSCWKLVQRPFSRTAERVWAHCGLISHLSMECWTADGKSCCDRTFETPGGKWRDARVWDEEGRKRRAHINMSKDTMGDENSQQGARQIGTTGRMGARVRAKLAQQFRRMGARV